MLPYADNEITEIFTEGVHVTDALGSSMSREVDKRQESLKARGIARGGPYELSVQLVAVVGRVDSDYYREESEGSIARKLLELWDSSDLKADTMAMKGLFEAGFKDMTEAAGNAVKGHGIRGLTGYESALGENISRCSIYLLY